MKNFKKFVAVALAAAMTITAFGGCSKENADDKKTEEIVATTTDATEDVTTEETATEKITTEEVTTTEEPLGVSDGDEVINLTFDKDVEGFLTYTNGGDESISSVDGELCVDIAKIGMLDYANQIYYDGFRLYNGCVYEFSFDVHSDIERKLQWRFQINGGDYHAYATEDIDIGPDTQHIKVKFTMQEDSDPAPRLCFNMGLFDGMEANTAEHKVYFDNIKLVAKDTSKAQKIEAIPEPVTVKVNQLGYKPADYKKATVSDYEANSFSVIDTKTGSSVYEGQLSDRKFDEASQNSYKIADFSEIVADGKYKLVTDTGAESYEFEIKDAVYDNMYKDIVLMLYKQRCGMATDKKAAGDYAHGVCHNETAVVWGTEKAIDVSGGWHDAGDYGRYVVSGAKTVADLFLAVEDSDLAKSDDMGIPESGNKVPDILDEARYELEWMLKMQDEETGGVYHKVTCAVFPGEVIPEEETEPLVIAPVSNTATGDFAAVMAKAAVMYNEYDTDFAAECLAAARNAWEYLKEHRDAEGFKNPESIETGEYGDNNDRDEYFWAAVELYIATNEDRYKTYIDKAMNKQDKISFGLGWADVGFYGVYDYCMYMDDNEEIEALLIKKADELKKTIEEDGYGASLGENFPWGSNMSIANNGMLLVMAYHVTEDISYLEFAKYQVDYLLGRNAVGYCYVTGYGSQSPIHVHHRPSQVLDKPMPGMLVGGANSNLEDPYAKAVLADKAPELCYVDNAQSYSCNEVCIYWNSPLIYLLATLK
ncbi:MAG: glycoside hydrolase family 9 protein [Coprococcus sp.]